MSYLGRSAKLSLKAQEKVSFLATAGQTSKTGLSYTPSFIEVYVNGVLLTDSTDFTATNGNSITFTVALLLNDEVTVISLKTFTVADHYTKSDADTLLAAKLDDSQVGTTANKLVALDGNAKLPAVDGSQLTNLPAATLVGLTDTTVSTGNPTRTTNPSAVGHLWLNKTSGGIYVCTDATSNSNVWVKSGDGDGGVGIYTYDIFGDSSATALWTLDGHTNDYGGSYNGTNNAMTFNTGKSNASGDGGTVSGNGVAMTTSMSVQPPFSISFWLKTSGLAIRNGVLMEFGNNTYLTETYSGTSNEGFSFHQPGIKEQPSNGGISGNGTTWSHVVYTMSSLTATTANQKFYFNGSQDALYSGGQGGSFASYSGGFRIHKGLNGTIDHVRIFNKVISASEVTTLYNEI